MAKKQNVSGTPKVTSLPLPISDTPLVIDLPDGQKIVIGKLQQGSVIEVATWRGTGRPDSRTNRLMMGMNNGEAPRTQPESGQGSDKSQVEVVSDWKSKALNTAKKLADQTKTLITQLSIKVKKQKSRIAKIQPANQESSSALASASEVDEWLKKVLERSEKKSAKALKKKAATPKKTTKSAKKSPSKKSKR
jgi:hypothetical protein